MIAPSQARNVPDSEMGEVREYETLDDFLEGCFEDFDLETFVFMIGDASTRETVRTQFARLFEVRQSIYERLPRLLSLEYLVTSGELTNEPCSEDLYLSFQFN